MHSFHNVLANARTACRSDQNLADVIGFADYVPEKLCRIVRKAVSYNLDYRYPDARSFRDELNRLRPARKWLQVNPTTWQCFVNGHQEIITIQRGLCPSTIYAIGKNVYIQVYRNFREAQASVNKTLSVSTFQ